VEQVDRELLRLLDGLGPAPPRGRVVVLTSDHGEEFLEHGRFEHGHSLHQELLAVPLVVSGVEPGEAAEPAGLVDVAPTLLARAGLAHDDLPGRDLLARGGEAAYVAQNLLYDSSPNAHHAVRRGRWKLIVSPAGSRLYDLEADPAERRDRAGERPALAAELGAWEVGPGAAGPPQSIDRREAEALRQLGYVE
jgi:arylsulfatase A-like enzyme